MLELCLLSFFTIEKFCRITDRLSFLSAVSYKFKNQYRKEPYHYQCVVLALSFHLIDSMASVLLTIIDGSTETECMLQQSSFLSNIVMVNNYLGELGKLHIAGKTRVNPFVPQSSLRTVSLLMFK